MMRVCRDLAPPEINSMGQHQPAESRTLKKVAIALQQKNRLTEHKLKHQAASLPACGMVVKKLEVNFEPTAITEL